jgi:hypothetical protein
LQDHDTYSQGAEAVQRPPPNPAVLAALALRKQQQVCLQRVRYELERVRQLIHMVRKKEKVKWQVRPHWQESRQIVGGGRMLRHKSHALLKVDRSIVNMELP